MLVGAVCMTLSSSIAFSIVGILILAIGMGATNAAVFKILITLSTPNSRIIHFFKFI